MRALPHKSFHLFVEFSHQEASALNLLSICINEKSRVWNKLYVLLCALHRADVHEVQFHSELNAACVLKQDVRSVQTQSIPLKIELSPSD